MFGSLYRLCLLAFSYGLSLSLKGQEATVVSPNAIIDLTRRYYGTEANLNAVETIYYEGEILDPRGEKPNGLIRIFLKKPYFQRMEIQIGDAITIHCVNGLEGYHLQMDKKSGRKRISVLPPKRVETLMIGSLENLNFLKSTKRRSRDVKYLGIEDYQEHKCYELRFEYGNGIFYRRLINMQTGQVMMTEDHHDHIVCTKCGKVEEFFDEIIEAQQMKQAESKGYTISDHSLYIYGLCKDCQ